MVSLHFIFIFIFIVTFCFYSLDVKCGCTCGVRVSSLWEECDPYAHTHAYDGMHQDLMLKSRQGGNSSAAMRGLSAYLFLFLFSLLFLLSFVFIFHLLLYIGPNVHT